MSKTARILFAIAIFVVIVGGFLFYISRGDTAKLPVEAVSGLRPNITPARPESFPTVKIAPIAGWAEGETPKAAAGLAVTEFARDLDHPRWLYELPNGDVLVAESNSPPRPKEGIADYVMGFLMSRAGAGTPSANRITLLRDANGDGVAEARTPLLTGLNSPFGMAFANGKLYVANHDALVAFPYALGQTRITAKPERIVPLPGGGNHWTKSLLASPDGKRLYIGVGSTSNIGERGMEREDHRANVLEVAVEPKTMRIFASGLRNPVGLAWEPTRKQIWIVVNERDMIGGDLAPDYMAALSLGDFYGWPYSYWGGYEDRRVEERREDLLEYTRRPDYALGPHTASLGLAFGSLGKFQRGAFIGQHGSWNRKPPSGYKVVFVPFGANGFPNGPMQDVLTGFLNEKGEARGRPVGVIVDRKGGLLVADDASNRIWRVSAAR